MLQSQHSQHGPEDPCPFPVYLSPVLWFSIGLLCTWLHTHWLVFPLAGQEHAQGISELFRLPRTPLSAVYAANLPSRPLRYCLEILKKASWLFYSLFYSPDLDRVHFDTRRPGDTLMTENTSACTA